MSSFQCKMCGGNLLIREGSLTARCEYCGSEQAIPTLNSEKKNNLYQLAMRNFRMHDYDNAIKWFEQILIEDDKDADIYWSIVLCRYGIEYVDDPLTRRKIPTINRTQTTSILEDQDYQCALKRSDAVQKGIYEREAQYINEVQQGILAISRKEEPFDVFICYKETDEYGRRTEDSVLAEKYYIALNKEGLRTFFAKVTLESKLGSAYEPYIFNALQTANVMLVLGTKAEYFNAPWVRNEWQRFRNGITIDNGKVIIPLYKYIKPSEMPDPLSGLEGLDMGAPGTLPFLVREIKKILGKGEYGDGAEAKKKEAPYVTENKVEPLMKRMKMFLEDGDFVNADKYCEKVLDIDPENAEAYLGKFLVSRKIKSIDSIEGLSESVSSDINYKKAQRFANDSLKVKLDELTQIIEEKRKHEVLNLVRVIEENAIIEQDLNVAKALLVSVEGDNPAESERIDLDYKKRIEEAKTCFAEYHNKKKQFESEVARELGAIEKQIALQEESIRVWEDVVSKHDYYSNIKFNQVHGMQRIQELEGEKKSLSLKYKETQNSFSLFKSRKLAELKFEIREIENKINRCRNEMYKGGSLPSVKFGSLEDCKAKLEEKQTELQEKKSEKDRIIHVLMEKEKDVIASKKHLNESHRLALLYYNEFNNDLVADIVKYDMDFEGSLAVDYSWMQNPLLNTICNTSCNELFVIKGTTLSAKESVNKSEDGGRRKSEIPENVIIPPFITKINNHAFSSIYGSNGPKRVFLGPSVEYIGSGAFSGCERLEMIVIPKSVSYIGDYAFSQCKRLARVILSSGISIIDKYCFQGCTELQEITIPKTIKTLANNVFNSCRKLKRVTIPNSVAKIGSGAFCGCEQLDLIVFDGTKAEWNRIDKDQSWIQQGKEMSIRIICNDGQIECKSAGV